METEKFQSKLTLPLAKHKCWLWNGRLDRDGYGLWDIRRKGQKRETRAARISYLLFVGPIPDGLQVDHLCRNKRCVNFRHLELVTTQENTRRRVIAKTHCKRGHKFTKRNTYRAYFKDGRYKGRHCKQCQVDRVKGLI